MKKTIQKKELSTCCNAPVKVSTADEGTSCYVCTRCQKPCDILAKPFDGIASSTPSENICPKCHMDTSIRNPSGHCDHLYYPENVSQKEPEEAWEKAFVRKFGVYMYGMLSKDNVLEIRQFIKDLLSQQRTQTIEEIEKWSGEWLKRNENQIDIGTAVGYDTGLRQFLKEIKI